MKIPALIACLAAAPILPASAQITLVTTRDAIDSDLAVDWQVFGKDGGFLSTPVSHQFGPQMVSLSSSSGGLVIRREATTWTGDFKPGQYLLTQPYQSDNFILSFSPPVTALGTQIDPGGQQSNKSAYVGRFIARLCLYGEGGTFLGTVTQTSSANAAETGAARFIGARSAGAPISYASLLVSGVTPGFTVEGDLAVNQVDIETPPPQAHQMATAPGAFVTAPAACR